MPENPVRAARAKARDTFDRATGASWHPTGVVTADTSRRAASPEDPVGLLIRDGQILRTDFFANERMPDVARAAETRSFLHAADVAEYPFEFRADSVERT